MNRYKRAFLIGAAESAARTAGNFFHDLPTFSEKSIKLCYCYHLAANGQIEEARAYLSNETPYTRELFESVLNEAEKACSTIEF